jgi:hypothetical protein
MTTEFLNQLAKAYWNMDYHDFLFRTNFVDSDYAREKFQSFQAGCKKLLEFDHETLESILAMSTSDQNKSELNS